jgi:hypothetical protein
MIDDVYWENWTRDSLNLRINQWPDNDTNLNSKKKPLE